MNADAVIWRLNAWVSENSALLVAGDVSRLCGVYNAVVAERDAAVADLTAARAALGEIAALHQPYDHSTPVKWCRPCSNAVWPCPTLICTFSAESGSPVPRPAEGGTP